MTGKALVPTRPVLGHYGLDEEGGTVRRYINYKPTSNPFIFSSSQYCLINSRLLRLSCTYLPGMYAVCDSCIMVS